MRGLGSLRQLDRRVEERFGGAEPRPMPLPILAAFLLGAVVLFIVGLNVDRPWSGGALGGGAGLAATALVLGIGGWLRR